MSPGHEFRVERGDEPARPSRARRGSSSGATRSPPTSSSSRSQPLWLLTDLEERRSKQAEIDYQTTSPVAPNPSRRKPSPTNRFGSPSSARIRTAYRRSAAPGRASDRLSRLLDRSAGFSLLGLVLIAFGLGAAHAIQPGHGKTLVAATVVGERGSWLRGTLLALVTTVTHTGSVLLVALGLWLTRSSRYETIHSSLTPDRRLRDRGHRPLATRTAPGRLRRARRGSPRRSRAPGAATGTSSDSGWPAAWSRAGTPSALIVLAEAIGRLALGVVLLVAFSLGMAVVLIAVGWMAARCRQLVVRLDREVRRAEHWLGIAGSLVLCRDRGLPPGISLRDRMDPLRDTVLRVAHSSLHADRVAHSE